MITRRHILALGTVGITVGLCGAAAYVAVEAQGQGAPRYVYDPGWPTPLARLQ